MYIYIYIHIHIHIHTHFDISKIYGTKRAGPILL